MIFVPTEKGKKVLIMVKEYVEREVISEGIRKYYYKNPPNSSYQEGFDHGLDKAQRVILNAPAADVAPVVRCKDCRWRGREDCAMFYRCECGEQHTWETDDDFCSYGERL